MRIIRLVLVLFILVGLSAGGYYIYKKYFLFSKNSGLELVSADALLVFESQDPFTAWKELVSQPIWQRLADLPSLQDAEQQLTELDTAVQGSGSLEKILRGNQFVASLHPVGREEFDFLYIISFSGDTDFDFLNELERGLPPLSQINKRNYSGVTVKEYQNLNWDRNLTYAMLDNLLVVSYTSFLVEEAIRNHQNSNIPNFRKQHAVLFDALPRSKGLGVFRLSSAGLSKMVESISRDSDLNMIRSFSRSGIVANLELKFKEHKISLEGEAFFGDGNEVDFTHNRNVGSIGFKNLISNRTAAYFQYNLADSRQLKNLKDSGFQYRSTLKGDIEQKLLKKGFVDRLTGNLGYMLQEPVGTDQQDRILLIKTEEIQEQLKLLKEFNIGLEKVDLSLVPVDYYQNREIFLISSEEFPAHLFDGKFLGFPDTYITGVDDVLVMANSSKAMKLFIDDYSNDNTWGKTIQQERLVKASDVDTGFDFIVNLPRFYNSVLNVSSPNWKGFFEKYAPQLKSIDLITLQVTEKDRGNKVNLDFGYNIGPIQAVRDITMNENQSVAFANPLIVGPYGIQNFVDKSMEYLVQDDAYNVVLLTDEGEKIFTIEVDSPIVSEILQVDYYKNGKLQLLFATESQVYILDRLGNMVPGFPVNPTSEKITHLSLADYDNSRDYRYFLSTDQGNLYLLDREGKGLDGWNPNRIGSALTVKPLHHRIAGVGDRMVALSQAGSLYFFNRRGEPEVGSPIQLGSEVGSDYFLIERGSARDTRVVTITNNGEIIHINLRGEISYRNQLPRPDRETKFKLVKDQAEDRFLFVVHEYNKISVLDASQKELFSLDIFSDDLSFQLYSFGSDKNIFVVIDNVQEFTYLYNLKGEMLNTRPFGGKKHVDLRYSGSQNEYTIHVISDNRFTEYRLPL